MPVNKCGEVVQAVVNPPQTLSSVIYSFTFQPKVWCPNSFPAVSGRSPEAWYWRFWQTGTDSHTPATRRHISGEFMHCSFSAYKKWKHNSNERSSTSERASLFRSSQTSLVCPSVRTNV